MSPSAEAIDNNGAPVTEEHATKVTLGGKVIAGTPSSRPPPPEQTASLPGSDLVFR